MNIVLRLKSEIESIFVQEARLAIFVAVVSLVPRFDFLAAAARRSLSSCAAVHFLHVSDRSYLHHIHQL
jgi:hypothetical protein